MNRDPLLWNKILGAVLGALLIGTLSAFAAELLYGAEHDEEHGAEHGKGVALSLVSVESSGDASSDEASTEPAEPEVPLADLLAEADVAHGKSLSKKCTACHTFAPDGANRIGPNLWSIVGRSVATVAGFKYSKGMKEFGGTWSDEKLATFLKKPKALVSGTKMNFVGFKKAQDRADIVAWLQTLK